MDSKCTIYSTSEFVGKKWTLLILLELHKGNNSFKRYNQLKKNLGNITSKMLSLRLKELVNENLVKKRKNEKESQIACEYSLTISGLEFIDIIKKMKKWALKWKFKNKNCENTECKMCEV